MTQPAPPPAVPAPPPAAAVLFGDRLPLAQRYAALLADAGTTRGLIGPREVPRLWERHLCNCAALTELIAPYARVVDVGTGAGLPGLVLAIARPDLVVDVVEPLARRCEFLFEAMHRLRLTNVHVARGRADDAVVRRLVDGAPVVTARAVAPLPRLLDWCLPLVADDGVLLAMKGSSAADEVARLGPRADLGNVAIRQVGGGVLDTPTTVVVVTKRGR